MKVRSTLLIAALILVYAACQDASAIKSNNNLPKDLILANCPFPDTLLCVRTQDPVCGYFKNGTHSTYLNLCTACHSQIYGYLKGACCTPNPNPKCTKERKPVCGYDANRNKKNYSNTCYATAACATNVTQGTCPRDCPPSTVKCSSLYDPVCGTDVNGQRKTYANACVAKGQCAINVSKGACGGFTCTSGYTKNCNPKMMAKASSCGIKSDGTAKVYDNNCQACKDGAVTATTPAGDCKNPFMMS